MHLSNNFGITEKSYGIILSVIKQFPEIEKAAICGSRATGNYKKGSDIDIAIYGSKITFDTVARLQGILNEQSPIPYFVDIIDFSNCSHPGLKKHIEECGVEIYVK